MSQIFLSHSSHNNFQSIAIKNWLKENGWDDVFLDLTDINGGERWEQALHEAADRCDAVIFLVSKAWLESDWCIKEFRLAKHLNKHIFGVLIEDIKIDALPKELTDTWQLSKLSISNDHIIFKTRHFNTGEEQHVHFSEAGLKHLKTGLTKAGLDPKFFQWPPKNEPHRSPYRGMFPLEAEDAGIFFGREAPTIKILAKIRGLRNQPIYQMMVILGASGVGKSSFLRAGVLPRLSRDDRNFITLTIIRPEHDVLYGDHGLLNCLIEINQKYDLNYNRAQLEEEIKNSSTIVICELLNKLIEMKNTILIEGESMLKPATLILPIDQGEELFYKEGKRQSDRFLEIIKNIVTESGIEILIIVTIRSDTFDELQKNKNLTKINHEVFSLSPMPKGSYKDVIEGPVKRLNKPFLIEPELTDKLLEDIEQGDGKDALPTLAFTLERLYHNYGSNGDLTLAEYKQMQGIKGAINEAVETAISNALKDNSIPNDRKKIICLIRQGFIPWLAGIDPNNQTLRRRVAKLSEIPKASIPILNHLIDQRLLSTDKNNNNEIIIEITHDTLIRQWDLLRNWLIEDFAALNLIVGIKRASRDWNANKRTNDYLIHNGGRLQDAEDLKHREDFSRYLKYKDWEYLISSREYENQRRDNELADAKMFAESQKKEMLAHKQKALVQKKLAKNTMIGMVTAIFLFLFVSFMGWQILQAYIETNHNYGLALFERAKQEEQNKNYNKSNYYSAHALLKVKDNIDKVKITHLFARNIDSNNAIWVSPSYSLKHSGSINSLAYSPDDKTLISVFEEGEHLQWDLTTGQNQLINKVYKNSMKNIIYSIDSRVVISMDDHSANLWNNSISLQLEILRSDTSNRISIATSHDNKTMATASNDGTVTLWDIETEKIISIYDGHNKALNSITFSHDGRTFATSSEDNTIRLWNIITNQQQMIYNNHKRVVNNLAISKDSEFLASASKDNTVRVWDIQTGLQIAIFKGVGKDVMCLSFSKDSKHITTASDDGTVRLLNNITGKYKTIFKNLNRYTPNIPFSSNSKPLEFDLKKIDKLLDLRKSIKLNNFKGYNNHLNSVAISPDNKILALASNDHKVGLWNIATGLQLTLFSHHKNQVRSIIFSQDGKTIASTSIKGDVRIWDSETGGQIIFIDKENSRVTSLAFSPTGRILVTGLKNNTVRLWDIETGVPIASFKGHSGDVTSVAFSSGGNFLASASIDNTVRIWDSESRKLIAIFKGHKNLINNIVFSHDESILASSSNDSTVRIWDLALNNEILNNANYIKLWLKNQNTLNKYPFNGMALKFESQNTKLLVNNTKSPKWPKTHPFHWLSEAEKGIEEAMLQLGIIYHRNSNNKKAKKWYTKALKAGHPKAQNRLDILEKTIKMESL